MSTQSSIFAWRIPWTEEPGEPQPRGHKESDMNTHTHTHKEVGNCSLSEFEKHWLPRWNHCLGKMKQVCGQVGRSEAAVRKR